jgi:hypothetical protein
MKLTDPDYCESHCPVCTNARKGNKLAILVQQIEMALTFGGCPAGRARRKKYGVKPNEALPPT